MPHGVIVALILAGSVHTRDLSLTERIEAHRAVQRVYHAHQVGNTSTFEDAVPWSVSERQVRTSLQETAALTRYWNVTLDDERLAREIRRILGNTKDAARLREMRAALGDDPVLFAEIVARPLLVRTLARSAFRFDPSIHAQARNAATLLERALRSGSVDAKVARDDRSERTVDRRSDAAAFERWRERTPGYVAPMQELRDHFAVRVLLDATDDAVRIASFVVPKVSWDAWWAGVSDGLPADPGTIAANRSVEAAATPLADASCSGDDSWTHGALQGIPERSSHSLVWTGTEMIVWGGAVHDMEYWVDVESGGRYDPVTDTWTSMSVAGAPEPRSFHTAVWTGREMLIFGAAAAGQRGGRYDPANDRWSPMSTVGAPTPRFEHVAVWTGREMLVWGGNEHGTDNDPNTGGRYDPETDRWSPMSTVDAPPGRAQSRAVWTGREMLVWGGQSSRADDLPFGSGGRYDPALDRWSPITMTGAPSARWAHSAVWTGTEMIVWGGSNRSGLQTMFNDGARYDPTADAWTPVTLLGAPSPRGGHSAAWTGSLMLIWGGPMGAELGRRYDPASDTWTPINSSGQPFEVPQFHRSVWTGKEMIVWGGGDRVTPPSNKGGRYDPVTDLWRPTSDGSGPASAISHVAAWTGNELLTWGGWGGYEVENFPNEGGRFDPALDAWKPMTTVGAPAGRELFTGIWTGTTWIVWGGLRLRIAGDPHVYLGDGARYDPISDTWTSVSLNNAPMARSSHAAVWTGTQMIVWGGVDNEGPRGDGARYDPAADQWQPMSAVNAPTPRQVHSGTWTGNVMVIWGGVGSSGGMLRTGGRYNPATDSWAATALSGAPTGRWSHTAVWTGNRVVIWGGLGDSLYAVNTGARYNPLTDGWSPTSLVGAPMGRHGHTAMWTGTEMLVWGGELLENSTGVEYLHGGRYAPADDSWKPTSVRNAPTARAGHVAVWTGESMLVWSGENHPLSTGGTYAVGKPDADADGVADACDCASGDATATSVPNEAASLRFASDKAALTWYASTGGSGTVHDVVRGTLATFPVGSGGESCLASDLGESRLDDPSTPASGGYWYLVRGRNACGGGTYGEATGGTRTTETCP